MAEAERRQAEIEAEQNRSFYDEFEEIEETASPSKYASAAP